MEDGHEAQTSSYTKTINVENIIKLYDGLGTVKVEKKKIRFFIRTLRKNTQASVQDNDMIVVNNKNGKSQYLSFQSDMIEMTYDTSSGSMEQVPKILEVRVGSYVGNSESNIKKYKESLRGRRSQHAVLK